MKVEVEEQDLETLIFGTAVLKNIETALQQRKQDPFVKPHLEYTEASNSLLAALQSARRSQAADTKVQWDGELTKEEVDLLRQLDVNPVSEVSVNEKLQNKEIDALASKGCLRVGQLVGGAIWPGEPRADIRPLAGFALAVTQRGRDKLKQALDANKS